MKIQDIPEVGRVVSFVVELETPNPKPPHIAQFNVCACEECDGKTHVTYRVNEVLRAKQSSGL